MQRVKFPQRSIEWTDQPQLVDRIRRRLLMCQIWFRRQCPPTQIVFFISPILLAVVAV